MIRFLKINFLTLITIVFLFTETGNYGYSDIFFLAIAFITSFNSISYIIWSINTLKIKSDFPSKDFKSLKLLEVVLLSTYSQTTKSSRLKNMLESGVKLTIILSSVLYIGKYDSLIYLTILLIASYLISQYFLFEKMKNVDESLYAPETGDKTRDNISKSIVFERENLISTPEQDF